VSGTPSERKWSLPGGRLWPVHVALALVLLGCHADDGALADRSALPSRPGTTGVVQEVDDGDTVTLTDGRRIRYLGIDTPERDEPFYGQAKAENRRLVGGKRIEWRRGGSDAADRYGRILGIVEVTEGGAAVNVNAALVRAGLASVYVRDQNSVAPAELSELLEAQRSALAGRRGLWADRLRRAESISKRLVATRFRLHLDSCAEIRSRSLPPIASLEGELKQGKSFCRSCKPLAP